MPKEILKITSAGSVDDGKSTILARLLFDTGSIYDDQLSKNFDPEKIADLLDGLASEREQGITIDVAHRYFDSQTRRYHIADSPGHEQYTRNMATACAGTDALLLVVDANSGLKPQTFLHLEIALRLGIRQILFAINKMDLVSYSNKVFAKLDKQIEKHITSRAKHFLGINHQSIPVSGLTGANVVKSSSKLSWFAGPTLLGALNTLDTELDMWKGGKGAKDSAESLFQLQYVQRAPSGGRRLLGTVLKGSIKVGDTLFAAEEGAVLERLWVLGEITKQATQNQHVSVEIDRELDMKRGEILSSSEYRPHDQFQADLIWLSKDPGRKSQRYILKSGSRSTTVSITRIFQLDIENNAKVGESHRISVNQIVRANLALTEALELRPFSENQALGRFVLIDPTVGQTVAVGTINFALRRSENITRQDFEVTTSMHAELTGNDPKVIWFTGLSGSGKSFLANSLSKELYALGKPHAILDGDNLRFGLNKDLGFTDEDRTENIRRVAEVAKLMSDSGLIVLVALVSPLNNDRQVARDIIGAERFELVFVDTPIEVCEQRDPKGLYRKARAGEIPNFTGVTTAFEEPKDPSLVVKNAASEKDALRFLLAKTPGLLLS